MCKTPNKVSFWETFNQGLKSIEIDDTLGGLPLFFAANIGCKQVKMALVEQYVPKIYRASFH